MFWQNLLTRIVENPINKPAGMAKVGILK